MNVQKDLYVEDHAGSNRACIDDLVTQSGGGSGSGEVIDAFDFGDHGLTAGDRIYFSLTDGSPTLAANGWSAGDVLVAQFQTTGTLQQYVAATDIGAPADIDALSIHDHAFDDSYDPATDYVIYSRAGLPGVHHHGYSNAGPSSGEVHSHNSFGLLDTDDIVALEHKVLPCRGGGTDDDGPQGDTLGDGRVGLEDVVYGLQVVSGIR